MLPDFGLRISDWIIALSPANLQYKIRNQVTVAIAASKI